MHNKLQLYARQWGATDVPFSLLNEQSWLESPALQKASDLLQQTALLRGVMLLCGPNGAGKSALAARWLRQCDQRLFHPLVLTQSSLTGSSILASITLKLGKPARNRRERNLQLIEEAVAELERRTLILVLDEAQNYSASALEEVRLLLGLNLVERPLFALILIGDDYLLNTLKLRHQRALFSRISCHHVLSPWTLPEVTLYLEKALAAVGLQRLVFEPAAIELLASASAGLPRTLALLAQSSWLHASSLQLQSVTAAHVQKALEEVPYAPGLQRSNP